jgi:hypothetical protein
MDGYVCVCPQELAAETPEHVPHHVDDNELTHAPNTKRQEVAEGVYLYTTQSRGSPPLIVTYRVATDVVSDAPPSPFPAPPSLRASSLVLRNITRATALSRAALPCSPSQRRCICPSRTR